MYHRIPPRFRARAVPLILWGIAGGLSCPAPSSDAPEPNGSIAGQPLTPPSGPRHGPMFTQLAPETTGVLTENHYADPQMWWERYPEFTTGAVGTGIAIGDYDNDGRPDLFVVSKTEANRLFRNLGGWHFEDVTEKAGLISTRRTSGAAWAWLKGLVGADSDPAGRGTVGWNSGATFVDVNNDGALDLYVCRIGAPNRLYMNQGDGTFREEAAVRGLDVNDGSAMAAFADIDRDGWLDVYVLTNLLDYLKHPQGQPDFLFRNRGDGTFVDITRRAGISGAAQGHSATWWDYDDDGWPDLYVANDFSPPDRLYRNNRDTTFTDVLDRVVPHTPFSSMGADLGDVDNDGLLDLLVADMAATTAEKDLRGMADSRTWTHHDTIDAAPQYARNVLLLNTGTGVCREAAFLAGVAATDWTWSVRFADLDNDGWLDLHVTNGMVRELNNVDLLAKSMASTSGRERVRIMRDSPVLAQANLAYRNAGDLRFDDVSAAWGLDQEGVSFGAAFGDFDGDGDLDLAFANFEAGVTLLRNDSETGSRVTIALRGTRSNRFGIGATVQVETDSGPLQKRQLVLARGYASNSEPILHFGLAAASRIRRLTVDWPGGQQQVFEDLPVDRHFLIREPAAPALARSSQPRAAPQFSEASAEIGFVLKPRLKVVEEPEPQRFAPMRLNRLGPALAVGDLDDDGVDDVCVGASTHSEAQLFMGTPSGRFIAREAPFADRGVSVIDGPLLIFDANGDSRNDVLLTRSGTAQREGAPVYQPRLFLNHGSGHLTAAAEALPPLPVSAGALAAADFDRDGDLDLFLGGRVVPGRYPLAPQSALLVNQGGRFLDVTTEAAPGLETAGMITSALWSDVDDDGWIDLLVALEWGGIRFWRNLGGRTFADCSDPAGFSAAGSGWWYSLAAADCNGDGKLDYVAGNVGLNTQYQASPEHPALLFLGSFGPAPDARQLVEARWEGGSLKPWRTFKDFRTAIPSLSRRVTGNDAFARATLEELLGETAMMSAQRFAATEFRSGIFLSASDGVFRFQSLPRRAQIAPLQGVVAGDLDGDGHVDLYAVENSHAPVPVVGRFDGGISQFWRGDGRGHFTPVPCADSGLLVPGDGEALATIDLQHDGWPDFLVTRNGGPALAFRNQGSADRRSFRVVLRDATGNRTAVGARVTVEMSDHTVQVAEVHAGSGYLTQSSPDCFFGFTASNPPRRLRVRWPSSAETIHELSSSPPATLEIRAP